ncbi:hypothetical protein OG226_42680 [Streptomyces sp. NBC_01261]|uniref:hypothetical protein n=1 Tax=Streptomyces sp. NBC_01261 TaxID=2903802 RepID=UPI002E300415|nr:hypothetical protein [Streptomyces sp. NBC_01261]
MTEVVADGRTLPYGDVVAVAHHGTQVPLADRVLPRRARWATAGRTGWAWRR